MERCMLAQPTRELLRGDRYLYQEKADGERAIITIDKDKIEAVNRRDKDITGNFIKELSQVKINCDRVVLDAELCAENFDKLQQRALTQNQAKIKLLSKLIPVTIYVFDVLSVNGEDITENELQQRLKLLKDVVQENGVIKILPTYEHTELDNLLNSVKEKNGEGIMIKDRFSQYEYRRSDKWYKYKFFQEKVFRFPFYSQNPAGIRLSDGLNAVQVAGKQAREVKELIDVRGYADVNVQYLVLSKNGLMRFPSFRGLVKNGVF